MLDHHLWLRLGKQTIVWGKTELFRAQDQFNPQDLGIASLPSLEESRVPLLSARGIWSFYDVGPLQDVRLEIALNFDKFYPADTGRCGEPFAPRASCTRAAGYFAGSLIGSYIAGEFRYPYPWEDPQSLEGGARLEFRQDRVSYALTYFNGFDDFPYQDPIFRFERNVDPVTGRPRSEGSRERCDPEGLLTGERYYSGCLGTVLDDRVARISRQDALDLHHANQQLFTSICGATVTINGELDLEACGFDIWNSTKSGGGLPNSLAFGLMMAGQAASALTQCVVGRFPDPPLPPDPSDIQIFLACAPHLAKIPVVPLGWDSSSDWDGIDGDDDAFFAERLAARGVVDRTPWDT
jgi:hypothetical protein